MFDAFYIYMYYKGRDGQLTHVLCGERGDFGGLDIHGDQNFVPVEFAGAVATVLFYVSYVMAPQKEWCLMKVCALGVVQHNTCRKICRGTLLWW